MGSEASEAKAAVIPRIPQDIINEILGHLSAIDSDLSTLKSCALVSKPWVPSCRRHLFHTTLFTSNGMAKWLETFPVPEESPAHHVRDLRFLTQQPSSLPEEFFENIQWFTNAERATLLGYGEIQPLRLPPFWRLPHSITSLTVLENAACLHQIRDIMAQLPNLNSLALSGHILALDRGVQIGIGTVLRGTFGGQLRLLVGYADDDVIHMLMEIPTGLHFTEVQISGMHQHLFSTVRLAEACGENLVKLSYTVSAHRESHPFSWSSWFCREILTLISSPEVDSRKVLGRSFDFSKLPNLQEVHFGVGWMAGGVLWIPMALSTLRPVTSPRLSSIQLDFSRPLTANRSIQAAIGDAGDHFRRVADEVARIQREFKGAVGLSVARDSGFKVVFDTLNVRFHFRRADDTSCWFFLIHSLQILQHC